MIDKATVERIKDAADIVDVVSDYVHLIRRGANYVGLCPFHNERTPSFSVNKARNFCYCFSCHKGGSPVNFIMEKEGISYHDALIHLANKYGIKVEERELTDEEKERQSERENMLVANAWAMQLMEHNLHDTEEGRNVGMQYLYHRGVTDKAIKAFHLGYSIDKGNHLLESARREGYDPETLYKLGLIGRSQEGRSYDRFRGRVMFPILNSAGKVIAFGGRDLKGGPAKYVNSPESVLYKKSNELYGIFQAKNAIVKQDKCYLVEGYLDVIGMWQSGMENTIASSGTALTEGQIALIHRFTNNVTLIYDGDAAGIKASLRGVDMLLAQNLDVKVLILPDGDDPDSFSHKHTPEEFQKYVEENETDVIRFKAKVLLDEAKDDPKKRTDAVHSMVTSLASIGDRIKRNIYIKECSTLMQINEKVLTLEISKTRRELVGKMRREREKQRYPVAENEQHSPSRPMPEEAVAAKPKSIPAAEGVDPILSPRERLLVRYLIRYGMADFCTAADLKGQTVTLSVAEYIGAEFANDELEFDTPLYRRAFETVMAMIPEFKQRKAQHIQKLKAEAEKRIRQEIDAIASRGLSMSELEREEAEMTQQQEGWINRQTDDFACAYVGAKLASCEDDELRDLATEMLTERHQLSKYHHKTGVIKTERERLDDLLLRGILELKEGVLKLRIIDVQQELKSAVESGDSEVVAKLMADLQELSNLRSSFAKLIGERIIAP